MEVDRFLRSHRGSVVTAAVVVPLLVCWLLSLAGDRIAKTSAALALVLVVVAAAASGVRIAGIAAALAGAIGFDFFLTEPRHVLSISSAADVETAVLLLVVGAAVSEIAIWGRRQQSRASRELGYLDGIVQVADAVTTGAGGTDEIIPIVGEQIRTVLGVDSCLYDPTDQTGLPIVSREGSVVSSGRPLDIDRRGLPTKSKLALPLRSGRAVYGHYLLTAATRVVRPSQHQLRVAVLLADQVGSLIAAKSPGPRRGGDRDAVDGGRSRS